MSDRIKNILSFIDQDEDISSTTSPETDSTTTSTTTSTTDSIPQINTQTFEDTLYSDDKKYKSYRRKLSKQKSYPCNIDGRIFQTEDDMKDYLHQLSNNKRTYNKAIKQDQITKTKINIDNLQEIEDDYNIIADDNLIYKADRLYGFKMNGKLYKLPQTSTKDRKRIYTEIKKNDKQSIKKLLQTDDNEQFKQSTLDMLHDDDVKNAASNHINNDLTNDSTWTRENFIKLLETEMNKPKQETNITTNITTPPQPVARDVVVNRYSLNPKLFK